MQTLDTLIKLYEPVASPLGEVKGVVDTLWQDALRLVSLSSETVTRVGGKMLRPALCLMAAGAIGASPLKKYVRLASAFEALHIASLAHDDVIDRAMMRRGNKALNALWDNHAAVLGGDYLVARSVEILAEYDSCAVISNAISSVRRMAEGELFFFGKEDDPIILEDCIMLAKQKTASLFAEACSAPTYVIAPEFREALYAFGNNMGIAFQIVDDLLDITQPSLALGKPSRNDIMEGKNTIPIMFIQNALEDAEKPRFSALRNNTLSADDHEWITALVERARVQEKTLTIANEYADTAKNSLAGLKPGPYRDSMAGIVDFILVRAS